MESKGPRAEVIPDVTSREITQDRKHSERVDQALIEALLHGEKVGIGRDAVVFRFDTKEMNDSVAELLEKEGMHLKDAGESAAMKVLKVYLPGKGVKEYEIQQRAYQALKGKEHVARIPEPMGLRDQHIDERTKAYLNGQGAHLENNMEAVVMEFIPGKDMATIMYEFVLEKKGFTRDLLDQMSFDEKNAAVASRLGFSEGKNTNRNGDQKQFAEMMALNENGRKLTRFLRQNGFTLDPVIIEKVENALKALQANGVYHNDMHERNVMIREDGEVFVIDFGRSMTAFDENATDDFAVIRRWREISTSLEEEEERQRAAREKSIRGTFGQMERSPRWKERIDSLEKELDSGDPSVVEAALGRARGNDRDFEQIISAFLGISLRSSGLKATILDGFQRALEGGSLRPFEENKLKQTLRDWRV
jgi:RIO-like serine/threonine protein kinase